MIQSVHGCRRMGPEALGNCRAGIGAGGDYGVDKPTGLGEVIALRNNGASNEPMTNQFLLEESPWLPLALPVVAAVIAWARRSSSILVDMLRR